MAKPVLPLIKVLLLNLLLMLFYSALRLEYLLWNWNQFKLATAQDIALAFLVGIRFDASVVFLLSVPALLLAMVPWPQQLAPKGAQQLMGFQTLILALVHLLFQLPFLILNKIDVELVNFIGRRTTYDSLFLAQEMGGKYKAFLQTYWHLILLNFLLFFVLLGGYRFVAKIDISRLWPQKLTNWVIHAFAVLGSLIFFVIVIRGGVQPKPIGFAHASIFTSSSLNNLMLNTSFTFIQSSQQPFISRVDFFKSDQELKALLNAQLPGESRLVDRPQTPQNVVIIIMESFALEYMGKVNNQTGYTPFLDSLAEKGLFFKNNFANGRRSIEAIPAILASIPVMMTEPFLGSQYTSVEYQGLGNYIGGYSTHFFHGAHNGSMFFDAFTPRIGFSQYWGYNEYPTADQDTDGVWGIYDEPFFAFMHKKLNESKKPFLAAVFSLTSHHPYPVPEKYKDKFPAGPLEIHRSIAYADYSLQKFFEAMQKEPWYKDTLFVITGDHTQKVALKQYDNEVSRYRVPLIFYHPSYKWPQGIDTQQITQHIDIVPSVLDFLGVKSEHSMQLARSVFRAGDRYAVVYNGNRYLMMTQDYSLSFAPGHDVEMFDIHKDPEEHYNLTEPHDVYEKWSQRLKAAIQYFNNGLLDNRINE